MNPLLELLLAGNVDEFNAKRGQRRKVELFAVELAGLKLTGVDLSNAVLEKSDLTGTDFTDGNFAKADLSGVDASEAQFIDVTGVGCRLREAFLDQADCTGADFSHGDLSEATMTSVQGDSMKLSGAKLRETDLTDALLTHGEFVETRFHQAKLIRVNASGSDFTEASLQECDCTGADFSGAIASRSKLQGSVFNGANLRGARLDDANLKDVDFTNADLEGADLRKANLTGAKLAGAKLRGVNFSGAVLDGQNLSEHDLTDADLTGVDPASIGLSGDQLGAVAAAGISADPDAPLRFHDVSVARGATGLAVLWENHDTDETSSLRWAVTAGGSTKYGALPISADGVLASAVVAVEGGYTLLVLQERPGGEALLRWTLSPVGQVTAPKVDAIGYESLFKPVFRHDDGVTRMWGVAKRGPTLVVHKLGETGLELVNSEKQATVGGFLRGHHPVLTCKGGVVVPVGPKAAKAPLKSPSDFPERHAVCVPVDDKLFVVWSEDRKGEDQPGGIRFAWLGKGISPKPQVMSLGGDVASLDAIYDGARVRVAWIELGRAGAIVKHGVPDAEVVKLMTSGLADAEELRFATDGTGATGAPVISLTTVDEELMFVDLDGIDLGRFSG